MNSRVLFTGSRFPSHFEFQPSSPEYLLPGNTETDNRLSIQYGRTNVFGFCRCPGGSNGKSVSPSIFSIQANRNFGIAWSSQFIPRLCRTFPIHLKQSQGTHHKPGTHLPQILITGISIVGSSRNTVPKNGPHPLLSEMWFAGPVEKPGHFHGSLITVIDGKL